jgi:hypothetical protein
MHTIHENDRQEIRQSVRNSSGHTKQHRESPDLEIQGRSQKPFPCKRLGFSIASISVDAGQDELELALREETPILLGIIWEVDNENPA